MQDAMTDKEVMGRILALMYEKRHDNLVPLTKTLAVLGVPHNVLRSSLSRLKQKGLIQWLDQEVRGLGMGNITDHGIEAVENDTQFPTILPIPAPAHDVSPRSSQGFANASLNQTQRDYLTKKLTSIEDDAVEKALIAVNVEQGKVTLAGQLGNSRAYFLYNDAAFEVIKEALSRMVKITYHVTNGHSDDAAIHLDVGATKMIASISGALEKRFQTAVKAFGESPLIDQLKAKLIRTKDQMVEDFKHGMEGDAPLAKHQIGNVFNVTQMNSPAGQIAVGNRNVQSVQQQSTQLIRAIDELFASDGLKKLNPDQHELVRTLADLVRTEMQREKADASKIKSWIDRLSEIVKGAGLISEAAKVGAAFAAWLASFGG